MARFKLFLALMVCFATIDMRAESLNAEDQKAVIDAQIEILRKQAELNRAQLDAAGSAAIGLPIVISVMRVGDERIARLLFPNGVVGHYREGELIRTGMTLTAITPKQVIVSVIKGRKKSVLPLDFAAGANDPFGPGIRPAGPSQALVPPELLPPLPNVQLPMAQAPAASSPQPPGPTLSGGAVHSQAK